MADLKQVASGKQGPVELAQIIDDMLINGNKYQRKVAEGAAVMVRQKKHTTQEIAKLMMEGKVKSPRIYNFRKHTMYDPKTGKGYAVESPEDHEKYAAMGYTGSRPYAKENFQIKIKNEANLSPADFKRAEENIRDTMQLYFSPEELKRFSSFGIDMKIKELPPDIAGQNVGKEVLIDPETATSAGFILEDVLTHELMHLQNRINEQEDPGKYFRRESVIETPEAIEVDREIEEGIAEIRTTARMGAYNPRAFSREREDLGQPPYLGDQNFLNDLEYIAKGHIIPTEGEMRELERSGRFFRGSENPDLALMIPGNTSYIFDSWYGGPEIDSNFGIVDDEWDKKPMGMLWSDNAFNFSGQWENTPYKQIPVSGLGWVAEWKLLGPDILAVQDWLKTKAEYEGQPYDETATLEQNMVNLGGIEAVNVLVDLFNQSKKIREEVGDGLRSQVLTERTADSFKWNDLGMDEVIPGADQQRLMDSANLAELNELQEQAKALSNLYYTLPSNRYNRAKRDMKVLTLPHSEVNTHMGIAGKTMVGELVEDGRMVQLYSADMRPFSFPITKGEAGWNISQNPQFKIYKRPKQLKRIIGSKTFIGSPKEMSKDHARFLASRVRAYGRNARVIPSAKGSRVYIERR